MKNKGWLYFILIALFVSIIAISVQQLSTPKTLTKNEMSKQLEQVYNGQLQTLHQNGESFIATFIKDGSVYQVLVNPESGNFSNLQILEKNGNAIVSEDNTQNQNDNTSAEGSVLLPAQIDEQKAIEIALNEVSGELEHVNFENTSDGGQYFIEIEQEEADVMIQIHAITGKILSIEYDD